MKANRIHLISAAIIAAGVLATSIALAQEAFKQADVLKIDPAISYGKFENGLTYYIKVNKKPEKRASPA